MKKEVVFKIRMYPTVSETFVVSSIVSAIKAGHPVTVVADIVNYTNQSSQPHLETMYSLREKVKTMKSPTDFGPRLWKLLRLVSNPFLLCYFLKYCIHKRKIIFQYLFVLAFYAPYRKNTIFHVHFANRVQPLYDLKEIGFLKSPIIVTFHGYDVHAIPDRAYTSIDRDHINRLSNVITTNTSYLREKAIERGIEAEKIEVVPVSLDLNTFQPTSMESKNHRPFKIVSIGRLIPLKGHTLGIDVIRSLRSKGYLIVYTIIGEGPEEKKLLKKIQDYGLKDFVTIQPFKNQSELKSQLEETSIFLFPSTVDDTGRREAYGVVSLEAQAMGLPVIGFDSGGFPETIINNKTGIVVPDQDVEKMVDAIEMLIGDPNRLSQMSKAAITHVNENFAEDKTIARYLKFYE